MAQQNKNKNLEGTLDSDNPDKRKLPEEGRIRIVGKLEAVKTLNKLLENYLFPHNIGCFPKNYTFSFHTHLCEGSGNNHKYVDSRFNDVTPYNIPLGSNEFNSLEKPGLLIYVATIKGLGEDFNLYKSKDREIGPIFDDEGLHHIRIDAVSLKDLNFSTSEFESRVLKPLESFAQGYEKVSSRKAFVSVHF